MDLAERRDEHVRLDLGAYVAGALTDQDDILVEEHLASCPTCQDELDDLIDVRAVLGQLSAAETASLVAELGPPLRTVDSQPRPSRATGGSGPTTPSGPTVPGRSRRTRTRTLLAALALALVAGVGIGAWLQSTAAPTSVTLAGTSTDGPSGVSASIVVSEDGDQTKVEATVRGLAADTQYVLYAVTNSGRADVVIRWAGTDEATTTLTARLATPPAELAFFTITRADSSVVVTVRVSSAP